MKRLPILVLALACLLPLGAQTQAPAASGTGAASAGAAGAGAAGAKDQVTLDSSYGLGMLMASQIRSAGIDISSEDFIAGFKDYLAGQKTRITEAQAQVAIQTAVANAQAKKSQAAQAEGLAFLASNKAKAGVKVTASGLQYEVLVMGSGAMPKATDKVTVNYEGKLIDGTVFDSSYKRGEPISFVLNEVIKGWTEGLQLMPVGSKFRFYIPSELGYGAQGAGEDIPPNAVLIFDVELISIGDK